MAMEIPAKALLIIKGTPSRATVPGTKNIQAMSSILSGIPVEADGDKSEIMRVQYNPSSLSIRANASTIQINSIQKPGETSAVQQQERPPSIVLTVKLVFSAVNSKDAFMADKFRLSAGDMASAGVAIAKTAAGGYSVRPQIDGLMGLIMDLETQAVAFVWQDMVFEGQVSELRSSYHMFNMSGNPISGSVDISITQSLNESSLSSGDKALELCFAKGMAEKNPLEKASNLININL